MLLAALLEIQQSMPEFWDPSEHTPALALTAPLPTSGSCPKHPWS